MERCSGLTFNEDFFVGYSPERINPGDKNRRLVTIPKVTSGSTPDIADFVDGLYASIIMAGTYKAESIKVAEAAKVIENTQRDVNIALINELAIIFNKMGIDTEAALRAAGKVELLEFSTWFGWRALYRRRSILSDTQGSRDRLSTRVDLAGRRVNDNMGRYVVSELVKVMLDRRMLIMVRAFGNGLCRKLSRYSQ